MRARAVLLAAGRGTRLRPLTDVVPKPALPLLDVPLGARGLSAFRRAGMRALVNVSHLADEAERALDPYAPGAVWLREPPEPFGTAGTLREARAAGLLEEEFVIWNADVMADVDPARLLGDHRRTGATATVVVEAVAAGADFEIEGGRVRRFIDRRTEPALPGGRFVGISALARAAVDLVPREGPAGLGETILAPLAATGDISVVVRPGPAFDVGTIRDFVTTSVGLAAGTIPGDPPAPGRIIAVRGGDAYLGPGASAARHTLGRGAVVLGGSHVEPGAFVERAVVWPGERIPSGTSVTRSVWFRGAPLET